MGYYLADVKAAKEKIAAACPHVILEDWQDYGFRIVGYRDKWWERPGDEPKIILQPSRPENDQPEIVADIDELIKFWST